MAVGFDVAEAQELGRRAARDIEALADVQSSGARFVQLNQGADDANSRLRSGQDGVSNLIAGDVAEAGVIEEEERAVANERAADGCAVLVLNELRFGGERRLEVRIGVEP